jgi:ABC-2 type transport system permease protein
MIRKANKGYILFFSSIKAVFKKEFVYIKRSPSVIAFALIFPIVELFMLGYLLDINVKLVDTVIFDLSKTQDSRQFVDYIVNTYDFRVVKNAESDEEIYETLKRGEAKVGIKIPTNFSRRLNNNATADVLVLADGSNAVVTGEVVSVFNRIVLEESLRRIREKLPPEARKPVAVETRTSVLFNPNARSANFFLPALIVWELPAVTILLVILSIAGERERGTLEQLAITPINPAGLIIGKMLPYLVLAFLELCEILFLITYVFSIPINGSLLLLLGLTILYIITSIGIGLMLSAAVSNQIQAIQVGLIFRVVPPYYFTGFVFPLESTPSWFQSFTTIIPERQIMEVCRGIIVRGAGLEDLLTQSIILLLMSIITISGATFIYWRKLK